MTRCDVPETSNLALFSVWKRVPLGGRSGKRLSNAAANSESFGVTLPADGAMLTQSSTTAAKHGAAHTQVKECKHTRARTHTHFRKSGDFTIKQLGCLLVQGFRSFLQDTFCDQGGAGSHRLHGDRAGRRGLSLQQVMVDHLHHCLLQAVVATTAETMEEVSRYRQLAVLVSGLGLPG